MPGTGGRQRYGILGVGIDAVDPPRAVEAIEGWMARGERGYVCVTNVHAVMEAWRDEGLRHTINAAPLAVPDGRPLVWIGKLKKGLHVRRVYGPDLMLMLCERAAERGGRCFFYGGRPGVAERLAEALKLQFPGLLVVGAEAPPFRPLGPEEDAAAVARINAAAPDLVFVGLGCPKQERWMAAHRDRLHAAALLGVGAAFDIHTGRVSQAPRWMMRAGLEWLYRLAQEPRRLWHRYLVYNPLFVLLVSLELLGLRRYPLPERK